MRLGIKTDAINGKIELNGNLISAETPSINNFGIVCDKLTGPARLFYNEFFPAEQENVENGVGMSLSNCENTQIIDNVFHEAIAQNSLWSIGITSQYSPNNDFCCNITHNAIIGIIFTGECSNTDIANSTFIGKHSVGILLDGAIISPQMNRGNDFTGIEYLNGLSAAAWFQGDGSLMPLSAFRTDGALIPNGFDDIVVPFSYEATNWFEFAGDDPLCGDEKNCGSDFQFKPLLAGGSFPTDWELAMQQDTKHPSLHWEQRKRLFEYLKEHPDALTVGEDLIDFFDYESNTNIKHFYTLKKGIQHLKFNDKQALAALLQVADAITPANAIEANEQFYYQLYLTTFAKGIYSFTTTEQDQILEIAQQSPTYGGSTVYTMRQWANTFGDFNFPNVNLELEEHKTVFDTENNAGKVFPNPVQDILTLQLSTPATVNAQLRIHHTNGQLMLKQTLQRGALTHQLDVSQLEPGFYVLSIDDAESTILKEKIIVL